MKINSPQFNIMHKACLKASKVLIRDFGEVEKLQVSEKGPGDFVTASDKRVEGIIIKELEKSEIVLKNISNDINKIISNPIKLDEVPKYYKKLLNHKVNDIKVLIRL